MGDYEPEFVLPRILCHKLAQIRKQVLSKYNLGQLTWRNLKARKEHRIS
jgi:hypothetical protein